MKILLTILIFCILPILVLGGNKIAWQKFVNDTTIKPGSPQWMTQGSAIDINNNIYFAGITNGGDSFLTVIYKYSPDGQLLWKTPVLPITSDYRFQMHFDRDGKLFIDSKGNVNFVGAGYDTIGFANSGTYERFILLSKINSFGTIITTKLQYYPSYYYASIDHLGGICVLDNGDIYVSNIGEHGSDLCVNKFNSNFDSLYSFHQTVNLGGDNFESFPVIAIKDSFLNIAYSTNTPNVINHLYILQINMNTGDTMWQQNINTTDYYVYPLQLEIMNNYLYLCSFHLIKFSLVNGAILEENSIGYNSWRCIFDSSDSRIYCINWNLKDVHVFNDSLELIHTATPDYYPRHIVKRDSVISVLGVAQSLTSQFDNNRIEINKFNKQLVKLDSMYYTYINPITSTNLYLGRPVLLLDNNQDLIALGEVILNHFYDTLGHLNLSAPLFLQKICFNCQEDLKGRVYIDNIQNCDYDSNENIVENNLIHMMPEDIYTTTDSAGYYGFFKSNGVAQINYIPFFGGTSYCNSINTYTVNVANGYNDTLNFGLHFKAGFINDISSNIVAGVARPGFQQFVALEVSNLGNQKLYNAFTNLTMDSNFSFVSSVPAPDSVGGNHVFWHFDSLNILGTKHINIQLLVGAPLGYTFTHSCKAIISSDIDTSNNTDLVSATVIGSFDPNYKSANPVGLTKHHFIENKTPIDYYIEFQNTGTDTAFNIKIFDEIDKNLDISSLRITGASHKTWYKIENNVLKFYLDNVLLVDSNKDYKKSIGYITYSITPKLCNDGTVINNTAQIYFDFNEPVITNTIYHTIGKPGSFFNPMDKTDFNLFPNPSENNITNIVVNLSEESDYTIFICDYLGRQVQKINKTTFTNGKYYHKIRIENDISAGLYFVTLSTPNANIVKKWNIIR